MQSLDNSRHGSGQRSAKRCMKVMHKKRKDEKGEENMRLAGRLDTYGQLYKEFESFHINHQWLLAEEGE